MKNYFSLVLFAHTVFAMPFALIGFFLAVSNNPQLFQWHKLLLMLLCMVFARNAAMAFNRYLDRNIDAINPRTAERDIPSGKISAKGALAFTLINCLLFIVCTALINTICLYLSPVALAVVLGYSYTKRFTPLCHLILGLGLSLAPIGAYLVIAESFALAPLFFSMAVLCWVSGFDIIYALQDEEFDKAHNLRSIPSWLGKKKALQVSSLLHVLSALCILIPLFFIPMGLFYLLGVLIFMGLLIYQHRLISPDDLSRVNRAFFTTNGIASTVFAIFFFLDLYLRS